MISTSFGGSNEAIGIWVNPPHTPIPLHARELRFAIGMPIGPSTNSWKVWVRKEDAYVACRDNFREFKVSLHASGTWRVAVTEEALRSRADLVPPGTDRVLKKWRPSVGDTPAIIGFQIVVPRESLYLLPSQRADWPTKVVFAEPSPDSEDLTVVSIVVVRDTKPMRVSLPVRGAVIGVVPLGGGRTVQLVAEYQKERDFRGVLNDSLARIKAQNMKPVPPGAVVILFGEKHEPDFPWVAAVPADPIR
jgi:hypothetical protein